MHKIALGIEYDGTRYSGWQRQTHSASIQQHLEQALGFVADHPVELVCAGRTDAQVHACLQVAHFATTAERAPRSWMLGANCRLPRDIRVLWVDAVDDRFHARFSAVLRAYRYLILNDPRPSALFHNRVCWQHQELDHDMMQRAAQALVGEHDFSAFRASGCQSKSPVRRVESIEVGRHGTLISIDIKANAFLHHMVRNIAGSLIALGRGEYPVGWLGDVLAGRDRRKAGVTAPAAGLYFVRPYYPDHFGILSESRLPVLFEDQA
jgi:tRNA pseudouridine38-40 synthase